MYKSIKVHLGQSQELIVGIEIYLKCKYTYENVGFCILFKILNVFIKLSKFSTIFHQETSQAPKRPYDVSRGQNRYVTLPLQWSSATTTDTFIALFNLYHCNILYKWFVGNKVISYKNPSWSYRISLYSILRL